MSFLAPGFLFFTALLGIPIAIHLIGRSRAKVRRFAALDLLLRSERKVATRTKLRQLLLLVLRAAAIAAVPIILSRPFVEAESDLPAAIGGAQSAVIIVDDSLSMSLEIGGERLIDRAKARARRIADALGGDADAALLTASRGGPTPVPELTADRARLAKAIAELKPSFRATDVTGALKRAAQLLAAAPRSQKRDRRVYLISDLAAHGFEKDPPWAAGQGPELVIIDAGDGTPGTDRAITDLKIEPAPHLGPRGVRISVEVLNGAAQPVKELPVTLRVDGKPVAKGLVDVEAGGRAQKRFFHTFARGGDANDEGAEGVHEIVAELERDALPEDDRRYARVEVRRDVRVLVVDGDPRTVRRDDEVFYLETALRPGDRSDSQLDVTTVTPDELGSKRLADFDAIFLCNAKLPLPVAALREFVQRGGGLLLALGGNVDPDAWNEALGDLLPQPLQGIRAETGGARLGRIDRAHPILQPLSGPHVDEAFREARFTRYALLKPTAPSDVQTRAVLMRFEDGSPALIERRLGEGRVLLFTSTLDRDWNDLPIQPVFLPLMQQSARYLARAPMQDPEPPALVGQRHDVPIPEGAQRVEVRLPSGKIRAFERDKVAGRRALGFTETDEPGVYRVLAAGRDAEGLRPRPEATFVINIDPAEADIRRIAPEKLAQVQAGAGARKAGKAPRRRVELWHSLGAALLLLLLGEALLLRRK